MGKGNYLEVIFNKFSPFIIKHLKLLTTILLSLTLFPIISITSCTDEISQPPPKPPGYQEDIPWPSLADSPWPMNHHDPQNTGRSSYTGPKFGQIDWKIDSVYMESGVSIGSDSTIYFVSLINKKGLYAVRPSGEIKWVNNNIVDITDNKTTPMVSSDGSIYVSSGLSGKIYSLDQDGKIEWQISTQGSIDQVGLNIGLDEKLYCINYDIAGVSQLIAINPNGGIDWTYVDADIYSSTSPGTSFSPDGKTLYIPGKGPSILAFDLITKSMKWKFGNSKLRCAPTIDNEGNIYFVSWIDSINAGNFSVFCLKPDGSIKWNYDLGFPGNYSNSFFYLEGTIDRFGNYSFASNVLYSFDYDGKLRWKLLLSDTDASQSSLINDYDGNIYLNVGAFSKYYCVSKDGQIKWIVDLENQFNGYSPAISANNRLLIPTFKSNYFFSIK